MVGHGGAGDASNFFSVPIGKVRGVRSEFL